MGSDILFWELFKMGEVPYSVHVWNVYVYYIGCTVYVWHTDIHIKCTRKHIFEDLFTTVPSKNSELPDVLFV